MAHQSGEFIVEFIPVGNVVRVSAVCTRTGREVSIVGDPKASQRELETIAVRKLKYVLEKEARNAAATKKGLFT
ncbi:MAG: serine hydroxymethyltransferase [Alphaproteobacteria bacterium]|nr:serine hydroxymethyltransferase [Alphaproteobacteria bacterium]